MKEVFNSALQEFSVLVSVYSREKGVFLDAALHSIFMQTRQPAEVVLVKDGPLTPELERVIEHYCREFEQRMRIVALPENVGLGKALNEGLRHCRHEWVARMDSDDICRPERFEMQLDVFNRFPELSVVGSWIDEFSISPLEVEAIRKLPERHEDIAKFAEFKSPANHMTVMFRKSMVERAGGYLSFYLLEDYWLWGRLLKTGAKFYNIQQSLVLVRGGEEMAKRRGGWKYAQSEVRLMLKFRRLGLFGYGKMIRNILIRFPIRILPGRLRGLIYEAFLR